MFRSDFSLGTKVLVKNNKCGCPQAEKQTESKNDEIASTLREGRLTSEEGGLARKLGKRWNRIIFLHLDGGLLTQIVVKQFSCKIQFYEEKMKIDHRQLAFLGSASQSSKDVDFERSASGYLWQTYFVLHNN